MGEALHQEPGTHNLAATRERGEEDSALTPNKRPGPATRPGEISGLVPFMPASCGFRPTEFLSTLRPDGHPARRKTRSQRPGGSPVAGGTPRLPVGRQVTHREAPTWPGAHYVPHAVPEHVPEHMLCCYQAMVKSACGMTV